MKALSKVVIVPESTRCQEEVVLDADCIVVFQGAKILQFGRLDSVVNHAWQASICGRMRRGELKVFCWQPQVKSWSPQSQRQHPAAGLRRLCPLALSPAHNEDSIAMCSLLVVAVKPHRCNGQVTEAIDTHLAEASSYCARCSAARFMADQVAIAELATCCHLIWASAVTHGTYQAAAD